MYKCHRFKKGRYGNGGSKVVREGEREGGRGEKKKVEGGMNLLPVQLS